MLNRRHILKAITATGIGTALFQRSAAAAFAATEDLSVTSIKQAEWITGLELTDEQREQILQTVKRSNQGLAQLREFKLSPDVPMAIRFSPTSHLPQTETVKRKAHPTDTEAQPRPDSDEQIAFLPVHELSRLLKSKKLSSVELTTIYLNRLKKYAPMLRCVVTMTEATALEQAQRADAEISQGKYRGTLHGIPWGAKDLIAVKGYSTSWGIPYFKDRELEETATVAQRLDEAGAVLVAKLSLGALAQGDRWFGGMTRSPWNPKIGSSGSSAGSASAVVGGLVGFALGSETLGSILSPSIRCGASSLRPTFGRVSRHGCMPLSWSLDKIGPICRSAEDCALVFDAIHGADGKDLTAGNYEFSWPSTCDLKTLKVGYSKTRQPVDEREDLKIFKELGCELVELSLPTDVPVRPLIGIIDIEAASVFDELLRDGHTEGWNSWDEDFRAAQYVSAVDYVRIQRTRTVLIQKFGEAIANVDVLVNMNDLIHTNFTGHPSVVMPVAYQERRGAKQPRPIVLTGHLNADEKLLSIARAVQSKLDAHLQHPALDPWLEKFNNETLDPQPSNDDK